MKSSELNKRMKEYEACYGTVIPRRSYVMVRVDGRGFSKFTKNMNKPFDEKFSNAMNYAAVRLGELLSPDFLYTQSDEITMLFTDFGENQTPLFGNKVQKICSITAGIATKSFNKKMLMQDLEEFNKSFEGSDVMTYIENCAIKIDEIMSGEAIYDVEFDSRVFVIPDIKEVANCFTWRQKDATRNSISMATDAYYSHRELEKKSQSDKQEMLFAKGINWNDYSVKNKRGVVVKKKTYIKEVKNPKTGEMVKAIRSKWAVDNETPIFTQDWNYLYGLIPERR